MLVSIWSGTISFGLVTIPIAVYPATASMTPVLHAFHQADHGRVRVRPRCEVDGAELDRWDITRGYPLPDGSVVLIGEHDLAGLPTAQQRTIGIEAFVPAGQVEARRMYRTPYYLAPQRAGATAYRLLRDVMRRTGRAAIVRVAIGGDRERLAALTPHGETILMRTMWFDELRPTVPVPAGRPEPEALAAAVNLIEAMTEPEFRPELYPDRRRERLDALVAAKVEARQTVRPVGPGIEEHLADLMAALTRSVEAAKQGRAEPGTDAAA